MLRSGRSILSIIVLFMIAIQPVVLIPAVAAREMRIEITNYSVSSRLIAPGEQFTMDLVVKNISDEKITGLYVEVIESSGFSIKGSNQDIQVSASLDSGATASASITMVYNGSGDGQIPVSFIYTRNGYTQQITEERYLSVNVEDSNAKPPGEYLPILQIENKNTLYTSAGSQLNTKIDIQNVSSYSGREIVITASFNQDAPLSFPGEQMFYFRSMDSGETKTLNLSMLTNESAAKGTYILRIDYQFTNNMGESWEAFENLYIQVDDTKAPPSLVLLPHLDEDAYIIPGEDFELLISTRNEGQLSARDITISLEGLSSNGISMVSGSRHQYIDELEAATEKQISYMITAAPAMADDSYPIILKADYSDQTGAIYSTEQELKLRVSSELVTRDKEEAQSSSADTAGSRIQQLSRLEVGSIRFTGELKYGKPISVHCTYYNTSKDMLANLIIKIEGDFEITDETVFVGDMEPDSSGYYHGTIKPVKTGEITGRLVFSYQDQSDEPLVLTEPFTINIAEQVALSSDEDTKQDDDGFGFWYLIIPILIAGAATAGLQTQRKNRLDEEEVPVDEAVSVDNGE